MIDITVSIVKTIVFFVGVFFSIALMGKRGKAIKEAVKGNVIIIDTPNHK